MKLVPKSRSVSSANGAGALKELKKPAARRRTIRVDFKDVVEPRESFMDKFVIRGGNPLVGSIRVSGAKNAALPAMAAAILTDEPVTLENIPDVRDIQTERNLLVSMVAEVELGYAP